MSEAKLISPLLDGFLMGSSMSDHNGVACYPAMKEDSDRKFIVKVISVPESQKQLDALLLAGAYRKPDEARKYFKELSDGVIAEAETLQTLSKLEGFLPYEGWQIEEMEHHDVGYQVYLLGSYEKSLEKHMRRTMLTHLQAINLGLDLCSALATVRRAGYIYADLKPTNIFFGEDKRCRIGDLGFISLDALRYTALPKKYISSYTPRELLDPMAELNTTLDTYALGMVLYQIYNDGQLPEEPEQPLQGFPTPVNADYELAEIILKAMSPKAEDRYKDPQEMGSALAAYMQRNSVNETPVTPPSTVIYDPADQVREEPVPEEPQEEEAPQEPTIEQIEEDVQQELTEPPADETVPTAEDAPAPEEPITLSQDTTAIMAQAEELLSQEVPAGVELDYPEEGTPDPFAAFLAGEEDWTQPPVEEPREEFLPDPIYDAAREAEAAIKPKKSHKALKIVSWILVLTLILGGLGGGGFYYYTTYYLQTIDALTVAGNQTGLSVTVETAVDSSELVVACIDTYGNALRQPLVNGSAQFTDLQPNSVYRIVLEPKGPHKLVGATSDLFITENRTSVLNFKAMAGTEEGSVMLDFTVDGPEPNEWTIVYSTEGEEPRDEIFSGHNVTVKGLTLGKTYTFHLQTDDNTQVVGDNQVLEFTVSAPMMAENLVLNSDGADGILVTWDIPEGGEDTVWMVHCFNDSGYDQTITATTNSARIPGVDTTASYIVEVTAQGMAQGARATMSANPITVSNVKVDDSERGKLTVTWEYSGEAPEGGWLLSYGIDSQETQTVIQCQEAQAVISPRVPNAKYHFVIQTSEGASIFNNTYDYESAAAEPFSDFSLSAKDITAKLLKTPKNKDWNASTIKSSSYATSFIPGDPVSMVLHASRDFYLPKDTVQALYVLRDAEGKVLSKMITKEELNWSDLWMGGDYHDAELDLPVMPFQEGNYTVEVYFNEALVASADFTIEKS